MDNLALGQGGNLALASGALANGTNAGTVQTTVAIPYIIDGRFYSKAITNNIAIAYVGPDVYSQNATERNGGFTGGASGSTRLYGLFLATDGALSIVPGPIVDTVKLAAGEASLQYPASQKDRACIGVMRIALTAGTAFVPGTTALNAAGVTTSYINLASVPAEPLRS